MISVLLPVFNGAARLAEALAALLRERAVPDEVIVVDDGSTDDSMAIAERFAGGDPRVRVLRHERNRGAAEALNTAGRAAVGDLVYAAAADDLVLAGFLAEAAAMLETHPEAGLCFANVAVQFPDWPGPRMVPLPLGDAPAFLAPNELAHAMARLRFGIASSGALIRRAALLEAGLYRPELRWHADWLLAHAVAFRYGACFLPRPAAVFRVHLEGTSAGSQRWHSERPVLAAVLERIEAAELADVAPRFRRGGILPESPAHGLGFLAFMLADRRRRAFVTTGVVRRALANAGRAALRAVVPRALRMRYWEWRRPWQDVAG